MQIKKLFPTLVAQGQLKSAQALNRKILKDIDQLSAADKMGRAWSKTNYRGGYTSYASLNNLHHRSPIFLEFEKLLKPHAIKFAKSLGWNLKNLDLSMTDCWMNVMPKGTYHSAHLHPHAVLSGTYYVSIPPKSTALKLEDPRLGFFMNAPVGHSTHLEIQPKEGMFVFFESWLRHEVPPNQSKKPRVSLSFNYSIEEKD